MGIAWKVVKIIGLFGSAMVVGRIAGEKAGDIACDICDDINEMNDKKRAKSNKLKEFKEKVK